MRNKFTLLAIILFAFSNLIFAQAPTTQATNVTFSNVQSTQFDVTWTNGNGASRAVFVLLGSAGTAAPVNNTTYTANLVFGSGTQIGATGWFCVYNGTGAAPTITVTGLTAGSTYRVMAVEYNGAAGAEQYNVSASTGNPNNVVTTFTSPSTQATNVLFSSTLPTSTTISWTNGNGSARAVFVLAGSVGSASPVDRTTYTANTIFGSGTQIGATGWYCVYNGTGTTVSITGLTAGTTYRVMVTEYNGTAGAEGYNTTTATVNPANLISTFTAPSTQATNVAFTSDLNTSVTLSWTNGNGSSRAVFMFLGNTGSASPVDRTTYTANTVFGSGTQIGATGWYCVYNGTGTSATVTGLTASTFYRVMVCEYNGTLGAEGYNTTAATNNPSNRILAPTLVAVSPPTQANNAVGVSITPTLSWLASVGATTYDLDVSTDPAFGSFVQQVVGGASLFYNFTFANQLTNGVQYYWRVRAHSALSTSAWASYWNFITITPAVPYLTYPSNGTLLSGISTTFTWYSGVLGIKYVFQISTNSSFSSFVYQDTTTNTYYTLNNSLFLTGGTYYWRVIAKTTATPPVIINVSNSWQFTMPGLPQPIASYPTGNVSVYNNPPSLYWYLTAYNPNITQYIVRYRRSDQTYQAYPTSPSNLYGTFTTLSTNLFVTIPYALSPGYQYFWEVESSDGTNFSTWSSEASFTIYGSISFVVCYPSYPVGGATIYTNPPTLYWYTNVYAPGLQFQLQYADNSGFLNGGANHTWTVPGIFTNSYTIASALTAGHYYWHVQASYDGLTWGPYSAAGDFVVNSSSSSVAATVPTPITPTSGSVVYVLNPSLTWYAYSSSALEFQVIVATDPTLSSGALANPIITSPWVSTSSYLLSGLTQGAIYYWQVRSRLVSDHSVVSSWSTLTYFTVSPGAAAVVPIAGSPIGGTSVQNSSAVLSWIIPAQSTSQLTYDVQYGKKADFSDATTISNLQSTNVKLTNLDKGSVYYWRAASRTNSGSVSNFSSAGTFKTDGITSVTTEQTVPTSYELSQNYPNPFNPSTSIMYSLPQNSFVTIRIYDMLGREVKTLVNGEMQSGVHTAIWMGDNQNGNLVASGTYIYRITAGDYVATKKMVLLK